MKTYSITAQNRVECTVTVTANSLEEAKEKASMELETNSINEWSFMDGNKLTSWQEEGKEEQYF